MTAAGGPRPGGAAQPGGAAGPGGLTRPLLSLLAAAACTAALVGLARAAVGTASGQRLDQLILSGAGAHQGPVSRYAELAVETVSVPVVAVLLGLAVLLVLLRRRADLLLPLGVLVLGANLTTQVIKHLLVTREALAPNIDITPNSFPSGHTTLAATAMIALVLAGGRARVMLAPLGALWTLAAGIGTLVVGWHRPSDVVGAIVVAAAWTFLVLGADGLRERSRRARAAARPGHGRRRRSAEPSAPTTSRAHRAELVCAALLGLGGAAGLAYGALSLASLGLPLDLRDTAQQLDAFIATSALIAGGTGSWLALTLLLRTPTSRRPRTAERVP
ncbi:phosphatase PAP2 family protein [Brachybacterium saurashtrense]|uniref:PAP2 family protein n=1 Tax=Brachybacterium saurashtrense TaxID=556288 RepID=A0A345YQ34_9MICO|nr:phosphatase PAP2 family protein [Brachybacterium saurashtrense]AXK46036.1 PAP2 family protein [Brachybacterium saurashtrense]RRR23775.1 PAP2 family protein [Brachybacterium saurashtrense]